MIVLDASVVLDAILRKPAAAAIDEQIFAPGQSLHAPWLVDLEVAQVLRRFVLAGEISERSGAAALADFQVLPVARYPHDILLPRVWALRNNLTAYDAAYVALAEALDAPLLTCDRRLAASVGHSARIVLP